MPYNDKLDPDVQISAEEQIAFAIFNATELSRDGILSEETCSQLGRDILHAVLEEFRPDLMGRQRRKPSRR